MTGRKERGTGRIQDGDKGDKDEGDKEGHPLRQRVGGSQRRWSDRTTERGGQR